MNESGTGFVKVLDELYHEDDLYKRYSCHGSECKNCHTNVRPVMITPTYEKDAEKLDERIKSFFAENKYEG